MRSRAIETAEHILPFPALLIKHQTTTMLAASNRDLILTLMLLPTILSHDPVAAVGLGSCAGVNVAVSEGLITSNSS
jgi:hypothetical protein